MKYRYWKFNRKGTWYVEDAVTGKQESLRTSDEKEAEQLRHAKNEATRDRALSLALGRAYLGAHDPKMAKRTWADVMAEMSNHGEQTTQDRCRRAMRSKPFDRIRHQQLVEATAKDLLDVLRSGTSSTNHFLRRLHNLAIDLGWLPWVVLAPKLWPKIEAKPKRSITHDEHVRIVSDDENLERSLYYEVLWEIGASQSDGAKLTAENVDWCTGRMAYIRSKTKTNCTLEIGQRLKAILKQLPPYGLLFPNIARVPAKDRAGEFRRRCRRLGIKGVTLHSYRYAWAERAETCGYPERYSQQALGHASKAVHRAYGRHAQVTLPSLEEYEQACTERKIIPIRRQNGDAVGMSRVNVRRR
jgi:integrase